MSKSNEISIDMVMDISDFEENLKKSETKARDTGAKLSQELVLKMRLNIDDLQQKIKAAQLQLKSFDSNSDEARKLRLDINQYKMNLTEAKRQLNNYVNTGETTLSRLQAKFNQISSKMGGSSTIGGQFFQSLSDGMGKASDMASGLLMKLGPIAIALGAIKIGAAALNLGDKLEQNTLSFQTMTGSAEKAKNLLVDLSTYAQNSPFELVGIRDTAKQLMAVGIETENIIPTMKALGDVASMLGGPDVFGRLTYAFGQVKTAGHLTGMELRQFTEAGVPLLAELSKNLGVTQSELKDMISNGEVSFADVQNAFRTMTEEGGKFANGQAVQMGTLTGKWSNFKDQVNLTLESIGTALLPLAKWVVDVMSGALTGAKQVFLGFQLAFEIIIGGIIQLTYGIQIAWAKVSGGIAIVINGMIGTFKDLVTNTGILAENIGTAFSAMPNYIKKYLNKGIQMVEDFINKAGDGVNSFAKKLGMTTDLVGKVKFGTLSVDGGSTAKYKDFVNTNSQAAAKVNASIMQNVNTTVSGIQSMQAAHKSALKDRLTGIAAEASARKAVDTKFKDEEIKDNTKSINSINNLKDKLEKLKDKLGKTEIGSKAFKDLQKQIKATEKAIDSATDADKKSAGKKAKTAEELQKELERKAEEAKKAEEERLIKLEEERAASRIRDVKNSTMTELEKAKAIVKINEDMASAITKIKDNNKSELEIAKDIIKAEEEKSKKIKEGQKIIQDYYDKVVEGGDKVKKTILDLKKEIDELNKKLNDETGKKNNDIAQRRLDILEREKEIRKELKEMQDKGVNLDIASSLSQSTLDSQSGDNTIGDVKLSEYQKAKDLQKEMADLQAEQVKNSSVLDQKTFDDLQKYKSLSKTEQIMADYEKEKVLLDAQLEQKMKALATEEAQEKTLDGIKRNLELTFTAFLKGQIGERVTELDKLRQAALDAVSALKEAGVAKSDLISGSSNSTSAVTTTVNQTNNFSAKVTPDDVKKISNQISKAVANSATGIK